ncbi:MAG: MBL fold metallo-hydrolase [Planctomycetota bacterium]|nr:MAG: MBL fold metallo-hydrolase [Planctomycetota bacterium]REJ98481.1 MAG: MBL fold metallo-hydrolase [Planctomycetota bacterium]REK23604.1 MAG: MBL fold metallo-hydrolase [Planctomycetota bacterium]REK31170.1 MAG: MBL fold metallo-hydrolase [Planctomycetota bacterium]
MLFHQRFVPGLAIASYIVGDEKSGEAAVIDPTRDVGEFLQFAKENGLHIRHIIETHVHADFVCGSRELKARLNDEATIHCSGYGGDDWTQAFADQHVREGDSITMGDVRFGFQHVPGHTPEHIAVTLFDTSRSSDTPWVMFSGDFLFVGDVGRPDLLGEEAKQELAHQLYESIFERIDELPDITEVFPAHGAGSLCGKAIGSRRSSTVGFERRFNPSLQRKPEEQWVDDLLSEMPLSPPYFKRMKQVNRDGPAIIGPELPGGKRWSVREVHDRVCDDCLIVDVRSQESFAAAHIPDSINIPFGQNLPTWAGWVLPYDRPILIITDEPSQMDQVAIHLLRVGFDDVQGYLEGGFRSWETNGLPLSRLHTLSVHELDTKRKAEKQLTILDVRTEKEWNDGHIEGALHIHGGTLQDRVTEIPRDKPVAVVCGSGYRASIASSFLKREGFEDVTNVIGGMSAWKAAGLAVA